MGGRVAEAVEPAAVGAVEAREAFTRGGVGLQGRGGAAGTVGGGEREAVGVWERKSRAGANRRTGGSPGK